MGFRESIEAVLKHEGFYSNDAVDRGGPTKYGITQATLSIYRKGPVSEQMVKDLSLDDALKIYRELYWEPLQLDKVQNQVIASIILDQAINQGSISVVKRLQRLLGVAPDGVMGPVTLFALNSSNAKSTALRFLFASQFYYAEICIKDPTQLRFLRGWLKRTQDLLTQLFVA